MGSLGQLAKHKRWQARLGPEEQEARQAVAGRCWLSESVN
jgi:hypothetical protein